MTTPTETLRRILRDTRTIAVVGASRDPAKEAHSVPAYLQAQGYRIIPINPQAEEILGERAYPSLEALPPDLAREVDLALLFRPSEQVGPHVEAAIRLRIPVVWMQQGIRNDEWARRAEEHGLTVIQDLCLRTVHLVLTARG